MRKQWPSPWYRGRAVIPLALLPVMLVLPVAAWAQPGGCCVEGTGDAWSARPGAHDPPPCLPDQRCTRHSNLTPCPPMRCGILRKSGDPEGPVGVPHGWLTYDKGGVAYCGFGGEHRAQPVHMAPADMTQAWDEAVGQAAARAGSDRTAIEKARADSKAALERLCATCPGDSSGVKPDCDGAMRSLDAAFDKVLGPAGAKAPASDAAGERPVPQIDPDTLLGGGPGTRGTGAGAPRPPVGFDKTDRYQAPSQEARHEYHFINVSTDRTVTLRFFLEETRHLPQRVYVAEFRVPPRSDTKPSPVRFDNGRYYLVGVVEQPGRAKEFYEFTKLQYDAPIGVILTRGATWPTKDGVTPTRVDASAFEGTRRRPQAR